jgi:FkbM family methyltransferase
MADGHRPKLLGSPPESLIMPLSDRLKTWLHRALRADSPAAAKKVPGTMAGLLAGLKRRGPFVRTIIDVGASDARWSRDALRYFPDAHYLLLEAQDCHADALRDFAVEYKNSRIVMAAAGAERGHVFFDASDPFGGQATEAEETGTIRVPVTSLDLEIAESGLPGPYLVKLDTHGYEMPILQGAESILRDASALIIECYNFRLGPDCLLFYEICDVLIRKGFRPVDIADVMHRELDSAFWQMDVLFVRADREEFRSSAFRCGVAK